MSWLLPEEKAQALSDRHALRILRPGLSADGVREVTLGSLREFFSVPTAPEVAHYFMLRNEVATNIVTQDAAVKVAGTTTSGAHVSGFTQTNNRAEFSGSVTRLFKAYATASVTDGNNHVLAMYLAKNGVLIPDSETLVTARSGERVEGVSCQTVVQLAPGDFVEVWMANTSSDTDITVEDLSVILTALG